ncbi:MAG: peptidoglycan editing factor PgeF [Streptosporangiaceae bacterium]
MSLVTPVADLGDGVLVGFSSRAGGSSRPPYDSLNLGLSVGDDRAAVLANRGALAAACGLTFADLTWMRQVHGRDVWYAASGPATPPGPVDAMFTDKPGQVLCVLVADCAPVLLADPRARIVGVAHAGREGLVAGVVPALVSAMAAAGAIPARMRALIGPAICGRCYEVPAGLQARVGTVAQAAPCATAAGTCGLDIAAGLRAQLGSAGVGSISTDGRCTRESPGLYSYRRDGRTGRFAGLVWLSA